jgi:hypothetical protein
MVVQGLGELALLFGHRARVVDHEQQVEPCRSGRRAGLGRFGRSRCSGSLQDGTRLLLGPIDLDRDDDAAARERHARQTGLEQLGESQLAPNLVVFVFQDEDVDVHTEPARGDGQQQLHGCPEVLVGGDRIGALSTLRVDPRVLDQPERLPILDAAQADTRRLLHRTVRDAQLGAGVELEPGSLVRLDAYVRGRSGRAPSSTPSAFRLLLRGSSRSCPGLSRGRPRLLRA